MTALKLRLIIGYALYLVVSVMLLLLQSTGIMTLQLGTASAFFLLPLTIYAGYYFGEYRGAIFGLALGAVADAFSSTLIFNTIALTIVGFVAGFMMNYFFNRNFRAAIVLNVCGAIAFFFTKWLIIYAFSDPAAWFVLVRFSLTSCIYTAVLGIALFLVMNVIFGKLPKVTKF